MKNPSIIMKQAHHIGYRPIILICASSRLLFSNRRSLIKNPYIVHYDGKITY